MGEELGVAVVAGRRPGLGARSPGERAWVKRPGLRAGMIAAGGGRLTWAGEAGRESGGCHGARGVGRRFADCVPGWDVAPVIHSVARGGPECRAGLGGSIKWATVLVREARHRNELARACTSLGSRR